MSSVKARLKEHSLYPKKELGQHFLTNKSIAQRIIDIAGVDKNDSVIEIGAGLGILTSILSDRAKEVFAIEVDKGIFGILKQNLAKRSNIHFINEDALKFNYASIIGRGNKLKVVANLPYNIASELIFKLLDNKEFFSLMVLMVQKEMALRFAAKPNSKDYGIISVLSQVQSDIEVVMTISRNSFYPPPKVSSSVIKIKPLPAFRVPVKDYEWFSRVVKGAFFNRRKALKNSLFQSRITTLSVSDLSRVLSDMGIDPLRRGETLTLEEFAELSLNLLPYRRD